MKPSKKTDNSWSLYLIPDRPDMAPFRWTIKKRRVVWILTFFGGVFLFMALISIHYFVLLSRYKDASAKAGQYDTLKSEFETTRRYSFRLQNEIDELNRTIQKLKMMAGVLTGQIVPSSLGVGGDSRGNRMPSLPENLMEQRWVLAENQQRVDTLKAQLDTVVKSFQQKSVALSATPSILPVFGYMISGFGTRIDPFTGAPEFHEGVDISAPYGTPVVASADALVLQAGYESGFGNLVVLDHGLGIYTYYAHLSKILVKGMDRVRRWQIVGLVGSSGRSTAPHLHYEIRYKDTPLNPMYFMISK